MSKKKQDDLFRAHAEHPRIHRTLKRNHLAMIRAGKQVTFMVNGTILCLSTRKFTAIDKKIERYRDRIKALEAMKKG